jgi:prepilin-type N-terminal cleavage/methylation domain-containing protein
MKTTALRRGLADMGAASRAASPPRHCDPAAARGFTLVELLVVIAIIGILIALLLPAIQAAREAARRAQCQSNLKNVALAVLNYESNKKIFPNGMTFKKQYEASVSTLREFGPNWIIDVLPYLEEQDLRDSFDFSRPINDTTPPGPNNKNREARGKELSVLLCPSDANNRVKYDGSPSGGLHGDNWARTNYAGNSGRAFIYPDPGGNNKLYAFGPDSAGWNDDCKRGIMGPNVAVELRRITDGTSKTIMIGEIRTGLAENDARGVWAMGHAGPSLLAMCGAGGDDNGPNNCYHDSDDVYSDLCGKADVRADCFDCHGGRAFDQNTVRSVHTGGSFVAMADASVQFISDEIETSGPFGNCCTAWDNLLNSAEGDRGGRWNRITLNPCF